jgi:nucleotide-binding universal stress UspA family protein
MSLKILIAFDDSPNSQRAVEYVARAMRPSSHVTLLHVEQDTASLCDMNSPSLTEYFKSQQTAFCALEDQKVKLVDEAMDKAQDCLRGAGFEDDQIQRRKVKKHKGVAREIVREAADGYDLLVLGRHGSTNIKDYILGSISQKVLNLSKDTSVLFVN